MDSIHKYNEEGELVQPWEDGYYSVTTILDIRHAKKLWQWRVHVGWEEANKRSSESSQLGNKVHQYIHGELTGDWGLQEFTEDMAPYVDGWENWQEKYQPEVLESEYFVLSKKHGFAGTADLICKIDDELWIVDFKTGNKSISHGVQLAAYRQAYKEMTGETARTACLYLTPDNKRGWSWKEYKEPLNLFLAHKKIWDWQLKHEPHKKPTEQYAGGMIYVTDETV